MTRRTVIALGTFDGVHRGHMELINAAKAIAQEHGLEPIIYTFTTHPMAAFSREPALLMTNRERLDTLSGLCRVEAEPFTLEYASTSPELFIKGLVDKFGMAAAVAGFNYSFGDGGRGDTAMLGELGKELGYEAEIIDPVMFRGEPISSSRIRAALEHGDIADANEMLGRRYTLSGNVSGHRRIGRTIGFPTANIEGWHDRVIPSDGVYATVVGALGKTYTGITNVGTNPTVGGNERTIETYLIGFSGDLYGSELSVGFMERLRGEIRFASKEELAAQISRDEQKALCLLEKMQ